MLLYVRLMSSLRRIEASRANGARSKGPVTPEGKKRSAMNAMRHGLLSDVVVLEGEGEENFQLLLEQHVERLQPADGVEYALVEEMAAAYWRLHRNWAMEKRMIDTQARNELSRDPLDRYVAAFRTLSAGTAYPLLHRYETRLHNMYQRALRTFLHLRAAKFLDEPKAEVPNEPKAEVPNEPNEAVPNEPNAELPNEPNAEFPIEPKCEGSGRQAPACAATLSTPPGLDPICSHEDACAPGPRSNLLGPVIRSPNCSKDKVAVEAKPPQAVYRQPA